MKIDFNTRRESNRIDLQTITPIMLLFGSPLIISVIYKSKTLPHFTPSFSFANGFLYIFCLGFAVFFCKDCIHGQSPGKKALNLQVVNFKTKQIAGPFRCMIRDLFMILSPIEAVMLLINPTRRLGDYVAGTALAPFDYELKQESIDYKQIGVSYLFAYIFSVIAIVILGQF